MFNWILIGFSIAVGGMIFIMAEGLGHESAWQYGLGTTLFLTLLLDSSPSKIYQRLRAFFRGGNNKS